MITMRLFFFKSAILLFTSIFAIMSCKENNEVTGSSILVVEGWIDSNDFPIVKVTRSIQLGADFVNISMLDKYVERWAKVTISDGEKEVIMTGRYDKRYYPPFIYTTTFMRGEAGKTYHITVDTPEGLHAEANATIPFPTLIDSFKIEKVSDKDSVMCQLYGYTSYRGPCKVFTKVANQDTEFMTAYMGLYDSTMLSKNSCLAISRGRSGLEHNFTPYFKEGSTVYVKLSTLTDEGYRYWRCFEDMTNLSNNPLFPVSTNMPSNIQGGLGYWMGYGTTTYRVDIQTGQTIRFNSATPTTCHYADSANSPTRQPAY